MKTNQSGRMRKAVQVVLAAGLASGAAQAASFIVFTNPSLEGESTDKDHKGWSNVDAYSKAVANKDCAEFSVVKQLDKISPAIAEAAAKGSKFGTATISTTASYTDSGRVEYFRVTMGDVQVKSVALSSSGESPVMEQFTLAPAVVTITYTQQDFSGKTKGTVVSSYSCKGGR